MTSAATRTNGARVGRPLFFALSGAAYLTSVTRSSTVVPFVTRRQT